MGAGTNSKRNIRYVVVGLVLLASVLLHSFVNPVHADQESDEKLAKKFAPIFILTENPTKAGRKYKVLNPEPVEILGANSISNVQVYAVTIALERYYSGPIISSPSLIRDFFSKLILARTNLHSSPVVANQDASVAYYQGRHLFQAI